MQSPFPGMDPYIEACGLWGDFHEKLIGEIERALAEMLRGRYVVRLKRRTFILSTTTRALREDYMEPDVAVARRSKARPSPGRAGGTQVAELVTVPLTMRPSLIVEEEHRETFLEIQELKPERRLVTGIEILSPSNKKARGKGRRLYLRKRRAMLGSQAHFVEIDLLRRGTRMPMEDDWPTDPYYLLVGRQKRPVCEVWPAHFKRPLPIIPVPLAVPDKDVSLNLQPMIAEVYARSTYEDDIDYRRPLKPPLSAAESEWLKRRLKEWRTSKS